MILITILLIELRFDSCDVSPGRKSSRLLRVLQRLGTGEGLSLPNFETGKTLLSRKLGHSSQDPGNVR